MDTKSAFTLLLTQIKCHKESGEVLGIASDEVYIKVRNDNVLTTHFRDNTLHMDKNTHASIDIELQVDFMDTVEVELWDKDWGKQKQDDLLGRMSINREVPNAGSRHGEGNTNGARYEIFYRIIKKPIPTLRLHSIKCLKEHSNINQKALDQLLLIIPKLAKFMDKVGLVTPTPSLPDNLKKLFEKAFGDMEDLEAQDVMEWIADKTEGKDDVYMQRLIGDKVVEGGGFFPENQDSHKMSADEECYFSSLMNNDYYRFPLDDGPVTVQIREKDAVRPDIIMGSLTISAQLYDSQTKDENGLALMSAHEGISTGDMQGALYQIAFSVGLEDWSKDATDHAQAASK